MTINTEKFGIVLKLKTIETLQEKGLKFLNDDKEKEGFLFAMDVLKEILECRKNKIINELFGR